MVRTRTGHSLPELLVAVVFLGTALAAVGGAVWLGTAWADAAVTRQTAIRLAGTALDSLAEAPTFQPGEATREGLIVSWGPASEGLVRVSVRTAAAEPPIVELAGRRLPAIPVLPDVSSSPDRSPGPGDP